ncbi:WW domain-binding protein 4 [Camellia lanceoleosa]|nr:WW domain-binding protein 4 [Camellia lanceoleosa]
MVLMCLPATRGYIWKVPAALKLLLRMLCYMNRKLPPRKLFKAKDMQEVQVEQRAAAKELPEYLKQKLRARGILKAELAKEGSAMTDNKSETPSTQTIALGELPLGWVKVKDPASGVPYYYNESSGKSQWERPVETGSSLKPLPPLSLPEDWQEVLDEMSGQKYYYNTKTNVSQWEHPKSSQQDDSQHSDSFDSKDAANGIWSDQLSMLTKCMGCGGWGVDLVQLWGTLDVRENNFFGELSTQLPPLPMLTLYLDKTIYKVKSLCICVN